MVVQYTTVFESTAVTQGDEERVVQRKYPEIARQVANAFAPVVAAENGRRRAFVVVANKLGVSIDAVDSWYRGVRCIPKEKIEPLVRALGHLTEAGELDIRGQALVDELHAAREIDEPVLSWTERVDENQITLRVQQAGWLYPSMR
jgi:hypothetical protein